MSKLSFVEGNNDIALSLKDKQEALLIELYETALGDNSLAGFIASCTGKAKNSWNR